MGKNQQYDYAFEEPPEKLSEKIYLLAIGLTYIATKYTINALTFLPKKGLELIASKTTKSICKSEGVEDSELD